MWLMMPLSCCDEDVAAMITYALSHPNFDLLPGGGDTVPTSDTPGTLCWSATTTRRLILCLG
jgi:hypothetical protein